MEFKNITNRITCRQILSVMVTLGFILNYSLRVNLAFAIVEMVDTSYTSTNSTYEPIQYQKLDWDVYQKNQVLGSFFWGYLLTQLPGGRLSEVIGARLVFGTAILTASILTLLTPAACKGGYILVAVLRAIIGFCLGVVLPSIPPLAVKWIPPLERSKFMATTMATALGTAVTLPLCGFIINLWGWESVFYITGGVCLVWSFAWFYLVYDSPRQHPHISQTELEEIESKILSNEKNINSEHVPWIAILTSVPVWANVLAMALGSFVFHTVINQLPTYMNEVLHFDITSNGLLSCLPHLANYIMAVLAGYSADRLIASKKFSILTVRKLFTIISTFIPGLLMALQAVFGYIPVFSIALFTITLFLRGGITGSHLSNGFDIAPNYSGTILGIGNALGSLGGWFSTLIVAEITNDDKSFASWRYIFWILSAVLILGALVFMFFASATVQPWNSTNSCTIHSEELAEVNVIEKDISS